MSKLQRARRNINTVQADKCLFQGSYRILDVVGLLDAQLVFYNAVKREMRAITCPKYPAKVEDAHAGEVFIGSSSDNKLHYIVEYVDTERSNGRRFSLVRVPSRV